MFTDNGFWARLFRVEMAIVLLMTTTGVPVPMVWADGPPSGPAAGGSGAERKAKSPQEMAEAMDRLFRMAEEAVQNIPQENYNPQAIVEKVGKEPTSLFEWVRDQTSYVPYVGMLRGPRGVLMDRVGNSLDRSLLLATLLREAGAKARLVRATLEESAAAELSAKVRPLPTQAPPAQDAESLRKIAGKLAQAGGMDEQTVGGSIDGSQIQQARMIEEMAMRMAEQVPALEQAAAKGSAQSVAAPAATRVALDHWWVQYQVEGKWVDLDVLLPEAKPGQSLARPAKTLEPSKDPVGFSIPTADCHELEIRVIVEQTRDGKAREQVTLRHAIRPCDVLDQPIQLTQQPVRGKSAPPPITDMSAIAVTDDAVKQTEWITVLNIGDKRYTDSSVSDTGEPRKASKEGPIEQPVGGLAGGLGGMLGGGEGDETAKKDGELTAQWVEYEVRSPGQKPLVVRREIFDLVGPAGREAKRVAGPLTPEQRKQRALAMQGQIVIFPQVCWVAPAFVDHLFFQSFLANRKILLGVIAKGNECAPQDLAGLVQMPGPLLSLALLRRDGLANDVYLDRTNVLTYRSQMVSPKDGELLARIGFDIVSNDVAVRAGVGRPETKVRLEQGVRDTVAESLVAANQSAQNAANQLARCLAHQVACPVISRADDPAFAQIRCSADAQARMRQELNKGTTLLLVPGLEGQDPCWWRLDGATGQTLGFAPSGWGASILEYDLSQHGSWAYALSKEAAATACQVAVMAKGLTGKLDYNPLWYIAACMAFGGISFMGGSSLLLREVMVRSAEAVLGILFL